MKPILTLITALLLGALAVSTSHAAETERPATHFSTFAQATLHESPLLNRIRLAKQRGRSYPMDSLDFIMVDLERPETLTRHADFCTGDLTGRYLDLLAASAHLEPSDGDRMQGLFTRILKCQAPNGAFGRVQVQDMGVSKDELAWSASSKVFMGLLRYYQETGDPKALTAARGNAEFFFANLDRIREASIQHKKPEDLRQWIRSAGGLGDVGNWITEPMAELFGITGDQRCLDVCRAVVEAQQSRPLKGRLAHGVLTMLRGLQLAAIYTGDASWNKQPEQFRKEIAEVIAWPDGNISEVFPNSSRNEGCAIADWVMLNLYAGFISGEDEAYEKAENALWNALFLNQMVNGGFGHRDYESDHTYGGAVLSMECWFCCLHNAGLAMVEFADHAVTLRGDELRINLLVPGRYRLPYKGTTIEVEVSTRYPEKADTTVVISGAPKEMKTRIRIPSCIKGAEVKVTNLPGAKTRHVLSGRMGYQLEEVKNGVVLRYGPLVMAPLRYAQNVKITNKDNDFLQGYVFERIDKGRATIVPPDKDADGFYLFPKEPKPIWKNYEEGTLSRLAFDNLSINVKLAYPDGTSQEQRFWPECYSTTSTASGAPVPVVFAKPEASK
jgi:hypothetical protein